MQTKAMRDVFLQALYEQMETNHKIFFVAADFGSPVLDKIREKFPDRFINVGIAEQNLINVSTGLALEGFIVYAYAIAPFITMRCFEQIRVNIAILGSVRELNINIVGVGAGVSYTMSGPTHHCLEDMAIMKSLPNIEVFSPSDYLTTYYYTQRTIEGGSPKYLRLDAKPVQNLTESIDDFDGGFRVLYKGVKTAIISTGYMTQKVYSIAKEFNVTLIDLYLINRYDDLSLKKELLNSDTIVTIEEGFKNSGGLDSDINYNFKDKKIINLGFEKKYTFEVGDREFIHAKNSLSIEDIKDALRKVQ